jgi:hypothetical protein
MLLGFPAIGARMECEIEGEEERSGRGREDGERRREQNTL